MESPKPTHVPTSPLNTNTRLIYALLTADTDSRPNLYVALRFSVSVLLKDIWQAVTLEQKEVSGLRGTSRRPTFKCC